MTQEEHERHQLIHEAVEQMLAANENFAAIAKEAEQQGIDPHEVRHALGRAFLSGWWYHVHEGTGYDPDVMADWFRKELDKVRGMKHDQTVRGQVLPALSRLPPADAASDYSGARHLQCPTRLW